MTTISQRELRNDNAEIMRGVEQGEVYTVTRRGVPIAQIGPIADDSGLRLIRPARRKGGFSEMDRAVLRQASDEVIADLRGDR